MPKQFLQTEEAPPADNTVKKNNLQQEKEEFMRKMGQKKDAIMEGSDHEELLEEDKSATVL